MRTESCFVTGCAGFIGSHLVDRLLGLGLSVVGYDDLSTGKERFLENALKNPGFTLIRGDVLDTSRLARSMEGCGFVYHMAADADIRFGPINARKALEQNTIATFNVLEAMRAQGIGKIAFPSTAPVYGETAVHPTPEDAPFPVQTSFYGAGKLAAEGLIEAFCEAFGFQAWIFRLVSILGERYAHGHVFDFFRQLKEHPDELEALGDGTQRKSYLHVQDCLDAVLLAVARAPDKVNIFNLGTDEYCTVSDSIRWICEELNASPRITYAGGPRGWVGDNPFVYLDCQKMRALGWRPKMNIREGIVQTVRSFKRSPWMFEGAPPKRLETAPGG